MHESVIDEEELKESNYSFKIIVRYNDLTNIIGKYSTKLGRSDDYFTMLGRKYRSFMEEYIKDWKTFLIYIPSELQEIQDQRKVEMERSFFENLLQDNEENRKKISDEMVNLKQKKFYDFSVDNTHTIWKSVLVDAKDYMVNELSYSQKISKALVKNSDNANELVKEFKTWQKNNPTLLRT